ncbi:MAG: transporter substrate-binding protein [Eubacterium sp.]|jgi:ABC-type glycerol-3-phosphate transport system substrate-binding protein|nr:transporter substrate-binding protein [Eubacterium sp.]
MRRLRVLALVQAIALSAFLLASCGQQQTAVDSTAKASSEATGGKTSAMANAFGWEVPEKTIEITAFNAPGEYAPSEEQKIGRENMEKYILENFNVKLTMQTTDGDGKEAINLALASGSYPDVIYDAEYDTVLKFKQQNRSQELSSYMDTIGKDIKEKCGDTYPMVLDDQGKLWAIPIGVNELMEMPNKTANIRYDEWLQIGSPKIETPDDYYNALKEILKVNPKTPNGEKRYAMSLFNDQNYVKDFAGYWGLKNGWKIGKDNSFAYWTNTEEGKAMTKWFNGIYRDGLFDPDAFNNTFDDWKAKFSNEKIAGCIGEWWMVYNAGHEVWQSLDKNVSENKRYIQVGFKAPEAEAAYVTGKVRSGGAYTIITDKAKDVQAIMKFINFQATDVGMALFNWGIPNGVPSDKDPNKLIKEWNIDESGNWSFDEKAKEQFISETWDYNQEALLGTATYVFFSSFDRWPDGIHHVWASHMWFSENKWKTIMINNLKDTIYDATPMVLLEEDEDTALAEQAVKDSWTQYWPMVVQSKNDTEFEANWSKLQQAVNGAGIEGYAKTMENNYKKNMAKLSK